MLQDKTIVIGVTGGIAAYKTCEVVSALRKKGASVHVIMTKAGCQFVTPLTFQTLSNHFVISDMFAEPKTWEVAHIALAKKADVFAVVPATADCIGKVAAGIADDMLTTTLMACRAPVLFAPAMNTAMYHNPIVQANIQKLKALRYLFVEPVRGHLACGDVGDGKLADAAAIVEAIEKAAAATYGSLEYSTAEGESSVAGGAGRFTSLCEEACPSNEGDSAASGKAAGEPPYGELEGKKILVTAGPTREPLDPIRYITNRSSGKMGYALASQAAKRGAVVTLISGPTNLELPAHMSKLIRVETAQQMYHAVVDAFADQDIIIQSAAVADYRPKQYSAVKIKKTDANLHIDLERNPDIAYEIGKMKGNKILVGFAAETHNVVAHAVEKIRKKHFDFIVANDIMQQGAGCGTDTNIITIIDADGSIQKYPKLSKTRVADIILDTIAALCKNARW